MRLLFTVWRFSVAAERPGEPPTQRRELARLALAAQWQ
jgi:hypothetical protein